MGANGALQFAVAFVRVALDVLFQKLFTWHVPSLRKVGGSLDGQVAMVTGATSGIGRETALELGRRGATVILACRNVAAGKEVAAKVEAAQAAGGHAPAAVVQHLDLSSLESVRKCADAVEASGRPLSILINNAGVFDLSGRRRETSDGFEQHMGVNHLAHFLLTLRLTPLLLRSAERSPLGARIVNVASVMHVFADMRLSDPHSRRSYSATRAYGSSKCAQIMFTRGLRKYFRGGPLHVFAVHPGEVLTSIARHVPLLHRLQKFVMPLFLFTEEQGARASVHCATGKDVVHDAHGTEGYIGPDLRTHQPEPQAIDDALSDELWRWSVRETALPAHLDLRAA